MHWDVVRPWRIGDNLHDDAKIKRLFNTLYKLDLSDQMAYWETSDLGGIYFEVPDVVAPTSIDAIKIIKYVDSLAKLDLTDEVITHVSGWDDIVVTWKKTDA